MADDDKIAAIKNMLRRKHGPASSDFDLNTGLSDYFGDPEKLRPAAVLMPLIHRPAGLHVILTKRASHLKHHPGQISFPGGKVDASDKDAIDAALREADEEIGLNPSNVEVLGPMPFHQTVTHFQITPIIGVVRQEFEPVPEPGEVAEVFEVPLSHLINVDNFLIEGRFWGGVKRHYYVVPFGPYYIWGATAHILRRFATRMAK